MNYFLEEVILDSRTYPKTKHLILVYTTATPQDPKIEKHIRPSGREYSKAYYRKKKAEPATDKEKEETLIERATHLMEQRKIYRARARAANRAYTEANGIEIRKPGRQPKPEEDVPRRPRGHPRKKINLNLSL